MKNLITRIAMTLGVAVLPPALALAQATDGFSVREVCTNAELAPLSQKLWDFVAKQDKLEIYIAYLEACGDSPLTADFATQAREVVMKRTANYVVLPKDKYAFTKISDRPINAYYVS